MSKESDGADPQPPSPSTNANNQPTKTAADRERQALDIAAAFRSSPFPSPDELEKYARVIPDLPRTLVDQWIKEGERRHELAQRGQMFAAGLGALTVLGVTAIGIFGNWAGALALAGAGAVVFGLAMFVNSFAAPNTDGHLDARLLARDNRSARDDDHEHTD